MSHILVFYNTQTASKFALQNIVNAKHEQK